MTEAFDLNVVRVLEHWTPAHAVREVIANALDEATLSRIREPVIERDAAGVWHVHTVSRRSPFVLRTIGHHGIVIELGAQRTPTEVSWACLESIPGFLAQRGWAKSGGVHNSAAQPGTLHAHLLGYVPRDIANWITALLLEAGLVDVDPGPPLRLRLRR